MTEQPGGVRYFIVSDLHLDAVGDENQEPQSVAFARFVEYLAGDESAGRTNLVLLGDTFDFLGAGARPFDQTAEAGVERVGKLAARHPRVIAALSRLATAGHDVHVVAGNHDPDLHHPEVQRALGDRIGAFHAHCQHFEVQGLLHAEHGHRDHPGQRSRSVDGELGPEGYLLPLLGWYEAARRSGGSRRRAMSLALRRVPTAGPTVARLAGRAVRGSVRRRLGRRPTQRNDVLHRAALRLHRHEPTFVAYVFGHTHIAEIFPLQDGEDAPVYVNPGSWSSWRPTGIGPEHRNWYTVARIDRTGEDARVSILEWDDHGERCVPVSTPVVRRLVKLSLPLD